jgi:hypothetical protein
MTASAATAGDAELRAAHRARVFDAMATAGLDVLVLARRDSVAYATGARALWTAGSRPFGPACVLVEAARSVHLLSSWDAGVPPEVPFEHLYGVTWNGANLAGALAEIPGVATAERIGVEALSPGFQHMARRLAPQAELVPADDLMRAVRALKLPAEVARIRAAVGVAGAAMEAAGAALADGGGPPRCAWRRFGRPPGGGSPSRRPAWSSRRPIRWMEPAATSMSGSSSTATRGVWAAPCREVTATHRWPQPSGAWSTPAARARPQQTSAAPCRPA